MDQWSIHFDLMSQFSRINPWNEQRWYLVMKKVRKKVANIRFLWHASTCAFNMKTFRHYAS